MYHEIDTCTINLKVDWTKTIRVYRNLEISKSKYDANILTWTFYCESQLYVNDSELLNILQSLFFHLSNR